MTKDQINQIAAAVAQATAVAVAHALTTMFSGQPTPVQPKAAPKLSQVAAFPKKAAQSPKATPKMSKRHATIVATFKKRGIKDPKLFTDIKPYKLWLADGFQVKANQVSVMGLFHRSQVDRIAA